MRSRLLCSVVIACAICSAQTDSSSPPQQISKDAQSLHELATELDGAVKKTNEHVLSLEVLNKAKAIQELADKLSKELKRTQ